MKKVFLDDLPKWESGRYKGCIHWEKCVGKEVKFVFSTKKSENKDDINGKMKITAYNREKRRLEVQYKNKIHDISISDFSTCKISKVLKDEIYKRVCDTNEDIWINFNNAVFNGKGINWLKTAEKKIKFPFKYKQINGEIQILKYENELVTIKYKDYYDTLYYSNLKKYKLGNLLKEELYRPALVLNREDKRWVDLSNVPLNGNGIDWSEVSKNKMELQFKYDDIFGVATVIQYSPFTQMLTIKYNNISFDMNANSFAKCNLGSVVGKNARRVIVGLSDLATTHPELVKYFINKEDTKKYTHGSNRIHKLKCPNCGFEKEMYLPNLIKCGFGCPVCNDGYSFPNKIMLNILLQLNLSFSSEKTFKWSKQKRYDFYFQLNNTNYIIEMNGEQHYKKSFSTINENARSLEEEQVNDRFKKELALNNGVNEKNYITIDCRKSEFKWIRDNIINSKLNDIFDLNAIDWLKVWEFATNSMVKEICEIKMKNPSYSTTDINKITKVAIGTIIRYLKQGNELGWCNYNKEEELKRKSFKMRGKNHPRAQKIICLNTQETFDTMSEAEKKYKIHKISECIHGNRNSAGIHPITKERLVWMYYNDYKNIDIDEIALIISKANNIHKGKYSSFSKKIICLNDNKIFTCQREAGEYYNINTYGGIGICCNGKRNTCGFHPVTGEKLKWMFYDEYIKKQEVLTNA